MKVFVVFDFPEAKTNSEAFEALEKAKAKGTLNKYFDGQFVPKDKPNNKSTNVIGKIFGDLTGWYW